MSNVSTPTIDASLVERFRADGFVVVPDVFDATDMDAMAVTVDAAVAADQADDQRALADKSRYEQSFQQCIYLWVRDPAVARWSADPRPAAIAAQLLGVEAVRMWHDQALYKEAGGRETDPHQDHPYWPIAETDQVTAWIPLDGSTAAAGAMAYWPGSHRAGLDEFVDIFGDVDPDDIGSHAALRGIEPVTVEVPRGSVAFHHGLTAHRAGANVTSATRRVHTVIYMADGCRRGGDRRHPSVDIDGIEVGQPIDGELTPILWPAASTVPAVSDRVVDALARIRDYRQKR